MSTAFSVAPLRDTLRATLPALTNMFSPTKNPCVVKTTPMKGTRRFRYDPYRASVLAATPEKPKSPISFVAPFAAAPFSAAPFAAFPFPAAAYVQYPMMPTAAPYPAYGNPYAPMLEEPLIDSHPAVVVPTIEVEDTTAAAALSSSISSIQSDEAPAKHFAIVKFKHDTYPYEAPFRVAPGDTVIVQGDRGESIGTVRDVTTTKPVRPVANAIVRKATQKDRDQLAMLRRKEAAATKFCENAVKDLSIDMSIVDTEYQFDQNKLSIYYKSKGMVDFRRLQRVLFREFRCRVWLVNWNELVNDA